MRLNSFLSAFLALAFATAAQTALAQAFTVQGKVVDDKGEPMIGVTITGKGGKTLNVTDSEGRYTISLSSPTKLKFSYVGTETVTIDAKKGLNKDIVLHIRQQKRHKSRNNLDREISHILHTSLPLVHYYDNGKNFCCHFD